MKLDNSNNNKDSETNRKMMMNREKSIDGSANNNNNNNNKNKNSTNNNNNSVLNEKQQKQQEKLQKEKEKRLEKERKEREKKEKERLEKERKQQKDQQKINSSVTSGDINKLSRQQTTTSSRGGGDTSFDQQQSTPIPQSKSENMLSRIKKQGLFGGGGGEKNNKKSVEKEMPVISAPQPAINASTQSIAPPSITMQSQMQPPSLISQPKGRYRCQVVYLDESVKTFDIDKNAIGDDLITLVCNDLELVEREYFSLTYRDINNMKFWLDHNKRIKDQLKGHISSMEPTFNFEVKFYPPEPSVLQEELTRYLLTLQLRHDIMDGKLPCTFVTYSLLGAYTVQAELGDYDEVNQSDNLNVNGLSGFEYLEGFCFAPNQTPELLAAVAEVHKANKGQTPAEAEMHFLENAVKLAMYGVDLHNAKDSDGIDILVGVSASGLLVFRDHLRINRFAWPKILKISYKRNHFYLKLRPGEFEKYETTIGFRCPNHKAAKRLWKIAVEHHAFFRLQQPEKNNRTILPIPIPSFNSKFRYTGSTYMQSRHRSIDRNQPAFTRSLSKRLTQSMDRGLAYDSQPVQTAAANHYSRMKPHVSISNIPSDANNMNQQPGDLREDDELDMEQQQGDYNVVTENPNIEIRPLASSSQSSQQQQFGSTPPRRNQIQGPGFQPATPQQLQQQLFFDEQQQQQQRQGQDGSFTITSSRQPSYLNQQTPQNRPPTTPKSQLEPIEHSDTASFEPLDGYYTRVDNRAFTNVDQDPNANPMASIRLLLGENPNPPQPSYKVNPNEPEPQRSQRYVAHPNESEQQRSQRYVAHPNESEQRRSQRYVAKGGQQQQQPPQLPTGPPPTQQQPLTDLERKFFKQQQQQQQQQQLRQQQQHFEQVEQSNIMPQQQPQPSYTATSGGAGGPSGPSYSRVPLPVSPRNFSSSTPNEQQQQQQQYFDDSVFDSDTGGGGGTARPFGGSSRDQQVPPGSYSEQGQNRFKKSILKPSSTSSNNPSPSPKPEVAPKPAYYPPPPPKQPPPPPFEEQRVPFSQYPTSGGRGDDEYFEQFKKVNDYRVAHAGDDDYEEAAAEFDRPVAFMPHSTVTDLPVRTNLAEPLVPQNSVNLGRIPQPDQQAPFQADQMSQQQQQYQPQPTVRRQAPPPVPQDRHSSQSSINRPQQQQPPYIDSSATSSSYLNRPTHPQQFNEPGPSGSRQQPTSGGSTPGSQQGSLRQPIGGQYNPTTTTTTSQSYVREFESSRSASSITSTPDVNRVKKQIVVNENVNHKDLLLRAIQMATELDPNMEVQKVEISEE